MNDGVTKINDILFVQSSVVLKENTSKGRRRGEMHGMLETQRALKKFYQRPIKIQFDFQLNVSPQLDKLIKTRIEDAHAATGNFAWSSNCKVLCNRMLDNNTYRYCIALPYRKKQNKAQVIRVSSNQCLKTIKALKGDIAETEMANFYLGLGSIEAAVSWDAGMLMDTRSLPFLKYHVEKIVNDKSTTEKRVLSMQYPHIKKSAEKGSINELTISLYSMKKNIDNLSDILSSSDKITHNSPPMTIREYQKFLSLVHSELKKNKKLNYIQGSLDKRDISSCVLRTSGHCAFGDNVSSEKNTEYINASQLFRQGRKLDEIIKLLQVAINKSPGLADAYRLLGAALIAQEDYLNAAVYLNQAIQLDSCRAEIKTNLAVAYSKLGFKYLAAGAALDSLTSEGSTEWSNKKALEIWNKQYE